jgi:hypothetical protein
MASFNLPNTLTNGETADANDVMADLNAIRTFALTQTVHTDGANEMSGALTLKSGAPTDSRHAAHKGYVDSKVSAATDGPYVFVRPSGDIEDSPLQEDVSGWTTIKFGSIVHQSGNSGTSNGYQTSGAYEAPKAGLYIVSATVGGAADNYLSTRIKVGSDYYFGPRWNPDLVNTGTEVGPMSFTHVVKVGAAGNLIEVQFNPADSGDFRVGKSLTVAWLHA